MAGPGADPQTDVNAGAIHADGHRPTTRRRRHDVAAATLRLVLCRWRGRRLRASVRRMQVGPT